MVQMIQAQVTMTGSAIALSSVTAFANYDKCAMVLITPDHGNGHTMSVTGAGGVEMKQIGVPPSAGAGAVLDEFRLGDLRFNVIPVGEISVNGTDGDKSNVTLFVE